MTKYGLIAMSAKPYHDGHDKLIRLAAGETDRVQLFVSTSDRKRKSELPISGATMLEIWHSFIEPSLPKNVDVVYGGIPIRKVYELLGAENDAGSNDTYVIFSDPEDLVRNFPQGSLEKYAGDLYARGLIVLEPIHRTDTTNVSGTKMREWIATSNETAFVKHLPVALQPHGSDIFQMLSDDV